MFNGRSLQGHPGDTLASALIASGVRCIGRSFKYHRPRGFYGAGSEDPSSMLAVRDRYGYEPAIRAGQVRLASGMEARSVTGWPSAGFDLAAGAQLLSGLLGAGFYYKTFKWPNWGLFEPLIRRSTGFGRPEARADRREVHHRQDVCDVLIAGGGPAGLMAARTLAGSGLRIVLADEQPQLGGSLNWEDALVDGQPGAAWARGVAAGLAASQNVGVLTSTIVTAAYEGDHFTLVQTFADEHGVRAEHHWSLRARHVVLATGMIDRPLLFAGNDRPGIMLSSSVRRLIGEFGVAPAGRLVVYTNNDSGYLTAIAAIKAGIDVPALIDTRSKAAAIHAETACDLGIDCIFESRIETTTGYKALSSVAIRDASGAVNIIPCDGVAVSGGFTPLIQLACHRGSKPIYDEQRSMFVAASLPQTWHLAGGAAGALDLATALAQGDAAARMIGTTAGMTVPPASEHVAEALSFGSTTPLWRPERGSPAKIWVDLQNDVKVSDVDLGARENYVSVEHLKRYTTLGMGTDQGRTSNVNGLALLAGLIGQSIGAVGTTAYRPPYTAVRMGTIANRRQGGLFQPRRLMPAHAVHERLSAVFKDFGWERPEWYRSNSSERETAIITEMGAVRSHVGVFDSSPLGKIEVAGPDAAEFLGRFYVSNMATLRPGQIRYSVMLKEDGVIFDDGVVSCLASDHFLAGPTSSNAELVAAWFERWRQTEWPSMRVAVAPVTSNWASIAIAGPRARDLLARMQPDVDISGQGFAHMQIRKASIGGVPARIARVSFTGELQYEISVPARYASSLLEALLAPAESLKPCPVGMEAWLRLRLEKGYMHIGSDTNGRTTPLDVGMAGIVAKRTGDFIGKRSLRLAFAASLEREHLVGLVALHGNCRWAGGS